MNGAPVLDWSGWENRQLQMQIQGSFPFASLKGQDDDPIRDDDVGEWAARLRMTT